MMKTSTFYKKNINETKINQFCQSTRDLLIKIQGKYATAVKKTNKKLKEQ